MPSDLIIRAMRAPADYAAVADLLTRCGDTVTAEDLAGQDAAMPPHGALSTDDEGRVVGHDRVRYVCPGDGGLVGYAVAWRAPWTPAGVVDGDRCRPDWLFLALHDEAPHDEAPHDERVVGVCQLRATDDPHTACNDYTAVARSWRGHGIARALKLHAAGQAARSGIQHLRTEVEASNGPMLAVNDRLGYRRGRGHHRMVRTCGRDAG
ncbi:GNAT family N-acetyltransferase [Dactylosporangium sp. NPDC050588]|uniref:GNAT family N-acetyltransferase n=1 Tax=Dactylosporangium sp. NPDC050588 TaxID=3157211 RepID=UPI0034002287